MIQFDELYCNNRKTVVTVFLNDDGTSFYEVKNLDSGKKRRAELSIRANKKVMAELNANKEPAIKNERHCFLNRRAQLSQDAYAVIVQCVRETKQSEWELFQ